MDEILNSIGDALEPILIYLSRFALPVIGIVVVAACVLPLMRLRKQSPPEAWLLNAVNHDKLPLARFENSVGRSKHCDIVLNYPTVSRFHAVIARRREGWVAIDTGSKGGTKIDGLPMEAPTVLAHGQSVTFGTFEFMFYDAVEEARGAMY